VRQKLVEKQMTEERLEKVRKLREMKKFGKKVQIEVQQKREKEKRDMLEQVHNMEILVLERACLSCSCKHFRRKKLL
jgi:hypothetical protein